MARLVSTAHNDYEVAKAREVSMRQSIASLSASSGGDNDVGVKLRELERVNLANKALFENFLNRAKLTQQQSAFEESDARLISPALEPTSPAFPKTKIIVAVAFVVGLMLGLGLAVLFDRMRKQGPATTSSRANAFILGRVPLIGGRRDAATDAVAYMETHPDSTFVQAVAGLASRLAEATTAGQGRSMVVAALGHDEGATSLVLCLAAAAGAGGRRVLVIDADQPGRGLTTRLGLAGRPGLAEVLRGDLTANRAVVALPRFAVLPAGTARLDAKAASKGLRGFLPEACGRFDLVLIDAPAFAGGMGCDDVGGGRRWPRDRRLVGSAPARGLHQRRRCRRRQAELRRHHPEPRHGGRARGRVRARRLTARLLASDASLSQQSCRKLRSWPARARYGRRSRTIAACTSSPPPRTRPRL